MTHSARETERRYDVAVVGGGFFGCMLALELQKSGRSVVVVEMLEHLLGRASYHNQARVHHGYHYPRSLLTASRSRANFGRFVRAFGDCVVDSVESYYAVARHHSKVSARQFHEFFRGIGAPIERAPARVRRLFSAALIEEVFRVEEYVFDAAGLRSRLARELETAGIEVRLATWATCVAPAEPGLLRLSLASSSAAGSLLAGDVFNCTYSATNRLLSASGLPRFDLNHELAEIALVEPPAELAGAGVTVMCGPFFSIMPFPARGLHSLSHVRYTPHHAWAERSVALAGSAGVNADEAFGQRRPESHVAYMLKDAARYLPLIGGCRYVESLWEVKTTLPASDRDDGRPIVLQRHAGLPHLHCVIGAKIDNIFDLLDELNGHLGEPRRIA